MIKHLTRKELDITKYDHCIANAGNTRIYAYSWFLDIVCDDWDVLIIENYKAVMPLPKRKKYGINYIYLPPWVQQLGIFSKDVITTSLIDQFIKGIPKKFKMIDVFFNSENSFRQKKTKARNNFILSLNRPYKAIYDRFNKGRRSSIKKGTKEGLMINENYRAEKIIEFFKQNKGNELKKDEADYLVLNKLMAKALSIGFAESLGVVNLDQKLIGGAFFLKDRHRITYLFSAINKEGRDKQAMSFLIDHMIKKYAKNDLIFDFEGSVIEELASFFKSFGAEQETYFHLKRYRF
jgi:hypothetical protein